MSATKKWFLAAGLGWGVLLLGLVFLFWFLTQSTWRLFEDTNPYSVTFEQSEGGSLVYEGTEYVRNPNVHGVLLLGLQQQALENSTVGPQADTVILLTLNEETKEMSLLSVSRDLQSTLFYPALEGGIAGYETGPLCNAYALGANPTLVNRPLDGGRFTTASLSHELFDTDIERFVGVDMISLRLVVDLLEGIEVPQTPEFAALTGSSENEETVRLNGEAAELYLRYRGESLEDGANLERMERQEIFLNILLTNIIEECKDSPVFALQMARVFNAYVTTDLSLREMIHIAYFFLTAESVSFDTMQGEMQGVDFYMDEADTEDYIRNLYYEPVSS